jgi:hypothetical protein
MILAQDIAPKPVLDGDRNSRDEPLKRAMGVVAWTAQPHQRIRQGG